MILDALEIPNLSYEILAGSVRVEGRVYTHHFYIAKHDPYDVPFVHDAKDSRCRLIGDQG